MLKNEKFNTLSGVVIPSVLAIFGAVVFFVAPRVLGGVGLLGMLGIILLAHSITLATAFSLSAIATNIHVKEGGLYYLISRSLGIEFGGSMGIQLFLAQTISISFYSIAFAKGLSAILRMYGILAPEVYLSIISFIAFWLVAYRGAQFVIKLQYFIFAAILASFISIFFAPHRVPGVNELIGVGGVSLPFWVAFVLFFPAVTGIDAGVGMSGDLKNPRKSLVRGVFISILFTMAVYIALSIKYFYAASLSELSSNFYVVQEFAVIPALVMIGVLLSTSSSALSYLMTAPRTLRALVNDHIFSKHALFFGKGIGQSNEPRVAMFITLIIGITIISLGDLFFVSKIVAIFFLNVYGWINGTAFLEKLSKNPSFRPSFDSPKLISFYGMVASYLIMYLFSPKIMIISIIAQLFIFYVLWKTKTSSKVESVWYGVLFQLFRAILGRIEVAEKSKKNWRPTIVAFCINDLNKTVVASVVNWISGKRGITKLYQLVSKKSKHYAKKRDKIEKDLKEYIKEYQMDLFPRVIACRDFKETTESVMQSETLGNLPLNTILVDFDKRFQLDSLVTTATELKKNVIILRNQAGFSDFRHVDVWWSSAKNGNMMILLAYLISHTKRWKEEDVMIRVFKVVKNKKELESTKEALNRLIENSRIDNITTEIILENKKPIKDIIAEYSHNSDLVILGLPDKGKKVKKNLTKEIKNATDKLPASLIVFAAEQVDLRVN